MVFGVARGPPVDEGDLERFVEAVSSLRAEEWQKRVAALRELVDAVPDYSSSPQTERGEVDATATPSSRPSNGGGGAGGGPHKPRTIPWYRSSKAVRRLATPLRGLLLDARSAVVKEAAELVGTLLIVKLQPRPEALVAGGDAAGTDDGGADGGGNGGAGGPLETIDGGGGAARRRVAGPPPPAFVGRLLLKDLLPAVLDLSKQTVKVIRTYGTAMMLDVLPHCRVKSILVVLLERMKTHRNRTLREDCARYLRCVLETWPWDPASSSDDIAQMCAAGDISIVNSRKEERLTLDSVRQIGLGLGRTLSDSAKPVRDEAKRGFQVLFRRFRPVWNEVMSSGVVRDIRLRKKLLEAAARSDGTLFDDASLGEYSTNSAVSGFSLASHASAASRRSATATRGGPWAGGRAAVPTVIGTPEARPQLAPRLRNSAPSLSSPDGVRGARASMTRGSERGKRASVKESRNAYSINEYVTSSGHVLMTPSPKKGRNSLRVPTTQQPFASLLQTPSQSMMDPSPEVRPERHVLRKRLSRRISGIKDDDPGPVSTPTQLSSINETEGSDHDASPAAGNGNATDIADVALEVVAAHLSHIEEVEGLLSREKDLLLNLNQQLGIRISDETETRALTAHLAKLSEEEVCDYFEGVHACADEQRRAGETLLREMERISVGDADEGGPSPDSAESPLVHSQRNLGGAFVASGAKS